MAEATSHPREGEGGRRREKEAEREKKKVAEARGGGRGRERERGGEKKKRMDPLGIDPSISMLLTSRVTMYTTSPFFLLLLA